MSHIEHMSKYTLVPNGDGFDQFARPAAPKLLDQQLRKLPGDYVTNEVAVGDRVHELDDPHTRESIIHDRAEAEAGRGRQEDVFPPAEKVNPDPRRNTLNQLRVDEVRLRIMRALSQTEINNMRRDRPCNLDVRHVWFPRDDIREYQLRMGNPPSDSARPKHMRGLKIHIDIMSGELPETIRDRLPARQRMIYDNYLADLKNPKTQLILEL